MASRSTHQEVANVMAQMRPEPATHPSFHETTVDTSKRDQWLETVAAFEKLFHQDRSFDLIDWQHRIYGKKTYLVPA